MSRPTASLSIAILGLFAVGASAQFSVDNFAGSAQDFFDAVFGAVSGVVVTSASVTIPDAIAVSQVLLIAGCFVLILKS